MRIYTIKETKKQKMGRQALVCLFWLALWQVVSMIVRNTLLLPGPWQTIMALSQLTGEKKFYLNIMWTLFRCLVAMVLSFAMGAMLAWCAYKQRWIRRLLTLPVGFFKAVPVMAIIIYVILLAKADWVAVIVCFLMCFPIVYTNILAGFDSTPEELLELGKVYWLTGLQQLKYIYTGHKNADKNRCQAYSGAELESRSCGGGPFNSQIFFGV